MKLDQDRPVVSAMCPCGKTYTAGYQEGTPTVFHELPTCRDYEEKRIDLYLEWARKRKEN